MIERTVAPQLWEAFSRYPVVGVVGPRQSGKSTLARAVFPGLPLINLEGLDEREYALRDPKGFLARFPNGVVLDEIQRTPDLPSYIQVLVDERRRPGQFVLTGSQNFVLMERVSQSLAGRIALFRLLPFSVAELAGAGSTGAPLFEVLFHGFYPRIHDRQLAPTQWLESYLETYIQRDVRTLRNIGDLSSFTRFLRLCAGRAANLLNLSSLAGDCGTSVGTAKAWLSVLEASFIIFLLPPHFESFNKRLIKAPKLHFVDVGLLAFLLGIRSPAELEIHARRGDLFENFVAAELLKAKYHTAVSGDLYFWRDKSGHEIDLLMEAGPRRIPIEVKSGQTVQPEFFRNLDYWRRISGAVERGHLVYAGNDRQERSEHTVHPWTELAAPAQLLA
ncbi:MAG: ATP-binding protein [Acidobacteria bacterium]|nr:ATP-binding protein [Acidobacteriota bacterium]